MTVVYPYTFVGGTRAIASQVNADFAAVANAVNANTQTFLTADTTFYVAPGGVDAPGRGLDPGSPAATIQFVLDLIYASYFLNGHSVAIELGVGSYSMTTRILSPLSGQRVPSNLVIRAGLSALPSQVIIDGDPCFNCTNGALVRIQGMTLTSSVSQCIISQHAANVQFQNVVFSNALAGSHLVAARSGSLAAVGDYTISGGAVHHATGYQKGEVYIEGVPGNYLPVPNGIPTVTLTVTPNFSGSFANSRNLSLLRITPAFVGSATGVRSETVNNGVIAIGGQGPTYLPGNLPGTDSTGGQTN
jgi:hypothetical protein